MVWKMWAVFFTQGEKTDKFKDKKTGWKGTVQSAGIKAALLCVHIEASDAGLKKQAAW